MLTAIMPIHNALPVAFQAIVRLLAYTSEPVKLVLIDNASDEDSARLRRFLGEPHVLIRNETNVGVYQALNQALALVESDLVIICCTDHWVQPHWFPPCLTAIREAHAGWVAPEWKEGPFRIREDWDALEPPPSYAFIQQFGSSCAVLDWKRLQAEVGLFDEQFFLVFGDTDYLERMNDAQVPSGTVLGSHSHHLGNQSRRGHGVVKDVSLEIADAQRFVAKWKDRPDILARHRGVTTYAPERAGQIQQLREQSWALLDPGVL